MLIPPTSTPFSFPSSLTQLRNQRAIEQLQQHDLPTQAVLPEPVMALSTSVNHRSLMNMVQAQQLMLEHIGDRERMHTEPVVVRIPTAPACTRPQFVVRLDTGQAEQAQQLSDECAMELDRLVVGAEQSSWGADL
jgi:hypothetical protein